MSNPGASEKMPKGVRSLVAHRRNLKFKLYIIIYIIATYSLEIGSLEESKGKKEKVDIDLKMKVEKTEYVLEIFISILKNT